MFNLFPLLNLAKNHFPTPYLTVPTAYIWHKDERVLPGKFQSRKHFHPVTNAACHHKPLTFSCNQSISLSVFQLVNLSVCFSVSPSVIHSVRQPVSQSVRLSISLSVCQSVSKFLNVKLFPFFSISQMHFSINFLYQNSHCISCLYRIFFSSCYPPHLYHNNIAEPYTLRH